MDFVRRAANPWGEEVLLGLAWDVFWLVVVLGAVFVVVHAIFAGRKRPEEDESGVQEAPGAGPDRSIPPRVERHGRSARISHWILAASVLVLLVTAFVPILGLQFPWVTIHWIAGVVLTIYLLYHVLDTLKRGTVGSMWIDGDDMRLGREYLGHFMGRSGKPGDRPGKWALENKVFHHLTGLAGLGVIATGLLMMVRVDTWFWEANPYVLGLSDRLWGWIYLLHGLAAVGFVGLLMAHIYFAVRPDKLWITRSMFKGWITRDEYLAHHDPARWPPTPERDPLGPSGPSPPGSTPEESATVAVTSEAMDG